MRTPSASLVPSRAGITLTEVLLGIMILGVGLVSLATLFPIGLLRLRAAQRLSRSVYLVESAAADVAARGLFNTNSFVYADLLNGPAGFNFWYISASQGRYDPLVQDRATYTADPFDSTPNPGPGASTPSSGGYGLPFAYDPLWRYQTDYVNGGMYHHDTNNPDYPTGTPECRFASGINSLRIETLDGFPASAWGLQRLTNFNRPAYTNAAGTSIAAVMPQANQIPSIFVSPEDVIWQDSTNLNYNVAFTGSAVGAAPSPIVPDLNMNTNVPTNDWRFTWMLTAQQTNGSNGAAYEGNIVIFENRPFAYDTTTNQAAGENVVEAIFAPGTNVVQSINVPAAYYAVGADRTVLLRWPGAAVVSIPNSPQPDPVVKVGDWIADVTYERAQYQVNSRFYFNNSPPAGAANPLTLEWDNLPAQRCFWYQVQKVTPAQLDGQLGAQGYRSMIVYVDRKLEAKTALDSTGHPLVQNAALIYPNVVNVVPQTFFVR